MNLIYIYYPDLKSRNAQPSYNPEHIFNVYLGLHTKGVFKLHYLEASKVGKVWFYNVSFVCICFFSQNNYYIAMKIGETIQCNTSYQPKIIQQ